MKRRTKELTLVIPDTHAHPDYDNDRFLALGNWIYENTPTRIICLGDFADMPSLSTYDKGKKSFEGRRFWRDVSCTLDAQEKLFSGIHRRQDEAREWKKKMYNPHTIHVLGNHDDARISRLVELHPELEGTVSIDSLQYEDYWDVVIPFKSSVEVEGVLISHYFPTGVKGLPVGGENPAKTLLQKNHMSSIQGHAHYFDMRVETRGDGSPMFGLVGGHFSHPDMVEGWNRDTRKFWRSCVHVFENLKDGFFDRYEVVSQESLMNDYL